MVEVVVVVTPLHQDGFRPVKETDWISEGTVQRLPRLVLSRFLASRHMGSFELPTVFGRSLGGAILHQAAAARFCYVLCVQRCWYKSQCVYVCGRERRDGGGLPPGQRRLMRARETLVRACPDVWFRTSANPTPAAPASLDRGAAHFFGTSLCRWWFMPKG